MIWILYLSSERWQILPVCIKVNVVALQQVVDCILIYYIYFCSFRDSTLFYNYLHFNNLYQIKTHNNNQQEDEREKTSRTTYDTCIFSMFTIMTSPSTMKAFIQPVFCTRTYYVVKPKSFFTFTKCRITPNLCIGIGESQLSTNNNRILFSPGVITYGPPTVSVEYFDSAFVGITSIY